GQEQVEGGGGHAAVQVVEVPPADQHQRDDDAQVAQHSQAALRPQLRSRLIDAGRGGALDGLGGQAADRVGGLGGVVGGGGLDRLLAGHRHQADEQGAGQPAQAGQVQVGAQGRPAQQGQVGQAAEEEVEADGQQPDVTQEGVAPLHEQQQPGGEQVE